MKTKKQIQNEIKALEKDLQYFEGTDYVVVDRAIETLKWVLK